MTSHTEPDESETAIRERLRRLGARPAGHAPADNAGEPAPQPPAATTTVSIPAQRTGSRLPDWRERSKPPLTLVKDEPDEPEPEPDKPEPVEPEPDGDTSLKPKRRVRKVRQPRPDSEPPADDTGEDDDQEDHEEDDEDEEAREKDDEIRPAGKPRRRIRRTGPSRRPQLLPPRDKERRSLIQAAKEMKPETKSAIYHLSGLAAGQAFGVVGFATDVARSLDECPLPIRDNPDAYFWIVVAVAVLALDRVTRNWSWLIAWATRGLTASLAVGYTLHGNTVGEALSNLPTFL
ncbi:hypothetical protein HTV80_12895 [Streptomyces sp. Vc74B-19]|uniref:hypothetical protein n=1 Tax=Streptomyces sp. Vc74B-19 TaxID=2741324 RepID=UPI001BFC77D2|nr:hypothetical protein [Streptomyces sp. Vc74B-19]MBT3164007.1 hypothetical protein [Streptomyces sp. Vc74B-19]